LCPGLVPGAGVALHTREMGPWIPANAVARERRRLRARLETGFAVTAETAPPRGAEPGVLLRTVTPLRGRGPAPRAPGRRRAH
jgi:hypothetical protein